MDVFYKHQKKTFVEHREAAFILYATIVVSNSIIGWCLYIQLPIFRADITVYYFSQFTAI